MIRNDGTLIKLLSLIRIIDRDQPDYYSARTKRYSGPSSFCLERRCPYRLLFVLQEQKKSSSARAIERQIPKLIFIADSGRANHLVVQITAVPGPRSTLPSSCVARNALALIVLA